MQVRFHIRTGIPAHGVRTRRAQPEIQPWCLAAGPLRSRRHNRSSKRRQNGSRLQRAMGCSRFLPETRLHLHQWSRRVWRN